MARKLKVYGWSSFRSKTEGRSPCQTREIVAAHSKAEVARIVGVKYPTQLFNLCETGNKKEVELCMANPGIVYWRALTEWDGDYIEDLK